MINKLLDDYKKGKITKNEFMAKAGNINIEYLNNGTEIIKDMLDAKTDYDGSMTDKEFTRIILHITRAMTNNEKITLTKVRNKKIATINTLRIEYTSDLKRISVMGQLDNV